MNNTKLLHKLCLEYQAKGITPKAQDKILKKIRSIQKEIKPTSGQNNPVPTASREPNSAPSILAEMRKHIASLNESAS